MKGIVLAGGSGSRLFPLTKITNKHLLPIYDRPMIYYPIQTLVDAGIQDIMIVTGGRNSGDFLRLLANGKEFGPIPPLPSPPPLRGRGSFVVLRERFVRSPDCPARPFPRLCPAATRPTFIGKATPTLRLGRPGFAPICPTRGIIL